MCMYICKYVFIYAYEYHKNSNIVIINKIHDDDIIPHKTCTHIRLYLLLQLHSDLTKINKT